MKRLLLLRHNHVNENLCETEIHMALVNVWQTTVTVQVWQNQRATGLVSGRDEAEGWGGELLPLSYGSTRLMCELSWHRISMLSADDTSLRYRTIPSTAVS